jgi:hypothetical protein
MVSPLKNLGARIVFFVLEQAQNLWQNLYVNFLIKQYTGNVLIMWGLI